MTRRDPPDRTGANSLFGRLRRGGDDSRSADEDGHRGPPVPDPILGWYEPEAPTVEMRVIDEPFGDLPPESPGLIETDERVLTGEVLEPEAPVGGRDLLEREATARREAPTNREAPPERRAPPSSQRASMLVAAGILLSRCAGLIRETVISRYLGTTAAADAFKAALRIPNLLQNLLGEGVLAASFIPVYARLRAERDEEEAGRLAGAIAGLLIVLTGVLSVAGVLLAGPLTKLMVPGFSGAKLELTADLVRIMFPGIGFLVLSAWCLGVLNSHRRFFLSYVAPVLWNAAQVAALLTVVAAQGSRRDMAVALAWGVLIGGALQLAVQLPTVIGLLGRLRLSLDHRRRSVRSVISRFGPVVMGRGVVQVLGYVDLWLASFLAVGAVSSLTYAQVLYLLPISVFGMSVAAAELPEMSAVEVRDSSTRRQFRRRLEDGMSRIAFYVAPTATLFMVVGDVIVRLLFEHGDFTSADTTVVWLILAAFSLGLLATTSSRLLQNALYALDDARTPARLAALRVVIAAVIGLTLMFPFDRLVVTPDGIRGWGDMWALGPLASVIREIEGVPRLGVVGLALGASLSAWVEYRMLSNAVAWRIGRCHIAGHWLNPIALASAAAALVAFAAEAAFGTTPALIAALLVLGPAAGTYLLVTKLLRMPEAETLLERASRLANRRR